MKRKRMRSHALSYISSGGSACFWPIFDADAKGSPTRRKIYCKYWVTCSGVSDGFRNFPIPFNPTRFLPHRPLIAYTNPATCKEGAKWNGRNCDKLGWVSECRDDSPPNTPMRIQPSIQAPHCQYKKNHCRGPCCGSHSREGTAMFAWRRHCPQRIW